MNNKRNTDIHNSIIDNMSVDGHRLTTKESLFIDNIVKGMNHRQAIINAGYKNKYPEQYANKLLKNNYIKNEIHSRIEKRKNESIATGAEVLEFFTKAMKGEIKDQFGLDASLADRTRAAQELAKRTIDIEQKLNNKNIDTTIKVILDK